MVMAPTIPMAWWDKMDMGPTIPMAWLDEMDKAPTIPMAWWDSREWDKMVTALTTQMGARGVKMVKVLTIRTMACRDKMEVVSTAPWFDKTREINNRINTLARSKINTLPGMLLVTVESDHRSKLSSVVMNWVCLAPVSHVVQLQDAPSVLAEV